jgi:chemotaxis protein methyltransferase CheR
VNAVTAQDLQLWSEYIKTICGNKLDSTKGYLIENRLQSLAQETCSNSWVELYNKVRIDSTGVLKRKVINAITTNETSFFRDTSPFDLLQNKILPDLIDARKRSTPNGTVIPIRIWSAACSTGQEIYSIAMVIREMLGNMKGYDIRLLGTDISDRAITVASYAKYSNFEIDRGMPTAKIEKFFVRDGDLWRVKDELRALASFKSINLLEPISFPYKFDIVFCRNVAIYFSEADRKKMYNSIGDVLKPDGYLLIGSTESITGLCPQFQSQRYLRSVYYKL